MVYVALNKWNYLINARSRSVGLQSPAAVIAYGIASTYIQQYSILVLWTVKLEAVIIMPPMNIRDIIPMDASKPAPGLHGYHISALQTNFSSG